MVSGLRNTRPWWRNTDSFARVCVLEIVKCAVVALFRAMRSGYIDEGRSLLVQISMKIKCICKCPEISNIVLEPRY